MSQGVNLDLKWHYASGTKEQPVRKGPIPKTELKELWRLEIVRISRVTVDFRRRNSIETDAS